MIPKSKYLNLLRFQVSHTLDPKYVPFPTFPFLFIKWRSLSHVSLFNFLSHILAQPLYSEYYKITNSYLIVL
jgi:hypothetical protein